MLFSRLEGMLFGGCRGEVWIMPGHAATQGALYQRMQAAGPGKGAVALVLGAGNQLPVVMLDILHMLVLQDSVVICKMNPVNEYLGPFVRCDGVCCSFMHIILASGKRCSRWWTLVSSRLPMEGRSRGATCARTTWSPTSTSPGRPTPLTPSCGATSATPR